MKLHKKDCSIRKMDCAIRKMDCAINGTPTLHQEFLFLIQTLNFWSLKWIKVPVARAAGERKSSCLLQTCFRVNILIFKSLNRSKSCSLQQSLNRSEWSMMRRNKMNRNIFHFSHALQHHSKAFYLFAKAEICIRDERRTPRKQKLGRIWF